MADPVTEPEPEVEPEVDNAGDGPIQVDSEFADGADGDSSYGWDDDSDSTQSLYSSITRHVYENGRRYHSYRQGAYW